MLYIYLDILATEVLMSLLYASILNEYIHSMVVHTDFQVDVSQEKTNDKLHLPTYFLWLGK